VNADRNHQGQPAKATDGQQHQSEISGRPKHIYSIFKKMTQKGKPFDLVRDVRAVRLIVQDVPSCYAALGVIHTHWRPIPGEFDDYIAAPKDNFYQSLHTAVIYDDKRPLEVQIRTAEMHQNAEYGIAAHWRYKEGAHRDKSYEQRINWLRNMMEWRSDVNDAQEFVEGMKSDVFQDRVYVFTPRGDIIDLAAGSTPIDFAYHVHTDIGHRCRGARVNGKLVPLYQELKTGDQVEILTAKRGGPSRDWLNSNLGLVKTQRARSKIKAWFKKQEDEQNLAQGRATLEREVQRLGIPVINFEKMARELGLQSPGGDVYRCREWRPLRQQGHPPDRRYRRDADILEDHHPRARGQPVLQMPLKSSGSRACSPRSPVLQPHAGRSDRRVHHPRPRRDHPSPGLPEMFCTARTRNVSCRWAGEQVEHTFPVPVTVKAYDRQGLMGDISTLLQNEGVNIADVSVNINRSSGRPQTCGRSARYCPAQPGADPHRKPAKCARSAAHKAWIKISLNPLPMTQTERVGYNLAA
jgi:GTP diphosphokinase / guanosine-3',5'-bis(diphosphate) 3'-diphosphatase